MTQVYLGLGSNIDRKRHLAAAVRALSELLQHMQVSIVYESEAVGFSGDPFYNLVVGGETDASLERIIKQLKQIEDDNGRDRSGPKYGPRTLDIDLLAFDELQGVHQGIRLPRSEIFEQSYVLRPLAELAPDLVLAGQTRSCAGLWRDFEVTGQALVEADLQFTD